MWLVKTDAFGLMVEYPSVGLALTGYTFNTLTLYRGAIDPFWNYVRVVIWAAKCERESVKTEIALLEKVISES
jgi:hypothetical protein